MEWYLSPEDGRFSLSLLAEGLGGESMSTSTSALGSTMAGSSKQAHSTVTDSGNDELSPTQNLIINALGITRGLALHEKGDIRVAYAKYIGLNTGTGKPAVIPKRLSWVRVRFWFLAQCNTPCTRCDAVNWLLPLRFPVQTNTNR